MEIYLVYSDEKSNKFWHIRQENSDCVITFGKVGTAGQTQLKSFDSPAKAEAEATKAANAKRKKGYADAEPPSGFAPSAKGASADGPKGKKSVKEAAKEAAPEPPAKAMPEPSGPLPGPDPVENQNLDYSDDEEEFGLGWLAKSDAEAGVVSKGNHLDYDDDDDDDDEDDEDDVASEDEQEDESELDRLLEKYSESSAEDAFGEAVEELEDMKLLWEHIDPDERADALKNAVYEAFRKFNMGAQSPQVWQYLFSLGAHETSPRAARRAKEGQLFDNALANHVWEEYKKDPRPERVPEIWNSYVTPAAEKAVRYILDGLVEYAELMKKPGKKKSDKFEFIPENGEFGPNFFGIQINAFTSYFSIRAHGADYEKILEYEPEELAGVCSWVANEYIPSRLVPELEKLAEQGTFDRLFAATGAFSVVDKKGMPYFQRRFDPTKAKDLDKKLEILEKGTDWKAAQDHLTHAFLVLISGIYGEVDEERAYNLFARQLRDCDDPEHQDFVHQQMINIGCNDYPRLYYERAVLDVRNHQYARAKKTAKSALENGYAPAKELLKEIEHIQKLRRALRENDKNPLAAKTGYVLDKSSFAKSFDEAFTERDLYLKTDNVVCRARCNGNIYVCFLIEGEQGYSEALDFINRLLERGYAWLSGGWAKGYALHVQFASEPEWIPQLENADVCGGLSYPHSDTHAFFARAVRYPALRPKVAAYAERALNSYHWYLDLTDEYNTVPGTFAVAALAFCGPEYLPLVTRYAEETDGDHTYIQNALAPALAEHYGNQPGCADAIWELALASGQLDEPLDLPDEVIWSASFMEEIMADGFDTSKTGQMEYFAIAAMHIYGEDVEPNLKKLASLAKKAASDEEKKIFVDFHNIYLAAALVWDEDECEHIKPLKAVKVKKAQPEASTELLDQEAVIPLKEAKKRGCDIGSHNYDGPTIIFFSPNCVTAPETVAYIKAQWSEIGQINSKPMDERPCFILLGYGEFNFRFDDWVVSSASFKYECGLIVYDGKTKPFVLYGMFNCIDLGTAIKKGGFKAERAEGASRTHLLAPSNPRRTDEAWLAAEHWLEKGSETPPHIGTFLSNWHAHIAGHWLESIGREAASSGDRLIYEMSRVYAAWLAEDGADLARLAQLAEELESLQPERKDYWRQKKELAKALQ